MAALPNSLFEATLSGQPFLADEDTDLYDRIVSFTHSIPRTAINKLLPSIFTEEAHLDACYPTTSFDKRGASPTCTQNPEAYR